MTTKVARHASKKASPSCNIISKLCSFNNFTETDFDQPTNYSLRYAEENSVIEEVNHFEYLNENYDQENTITTYYTEETPFETPLHFSTSTSTSDLLKIDETKVNNLIPVDSKNFTIANQTLNSVNKSHEESKDCQSHPIDKLKIYMEFKDKDKECESTDIETDLPDDLEDFDEKYAEERLEKIINVTPSQSPIELSDKEGKVVTFASEDCYTQQTPLMFSRCSSLGSLSGYEHQSLHDDRSSIVSDFSRRTSEAVSPSELPDSPAGTVQQKDKRSVKKKIQQQRDKIQSSELCPLQQETSKRSIFEDDLAVFKEESTPIKFQSVAASSLSSLTIDDDDYVEERDRVDTSKAGVIQTLKVSSTNDQSPGTTETFDEHTDFSVDEEKILDECIRKGIAKVTRQNINDVSSYNLQTKNTCDTDESKLEQSNQSIYTPIGPLDSFDENSDLTDEEEKLLDECIRRGIAKVTRQNINDVTSLSLRTSFSGVSTLASCDKNDKQDKQ